MTNEESQTAQMHPTDCELFRQWLEQIRRREMNKDSIGNRMKDNYENRYRVKLTRRTPVIIRLDGNAFHTLTRKCIKPFDNKFRSAMQYTAVALCNKIQGSKCAYVQSDEISILLTDFDTLTTEAWFDYNLQKIVSVSSGVASTNFTINWNPKIPAIFDSRAFNIPKEEVCNYFIWRQQDWMRNSILMLSQAHYSHKQLHGKNTPAMHEMLHAKGVNWAELEPVWKNGSFITRDDDSIWYSTDNVIFKDNREIVERNLKSMD